jgi:hypothetical protein
MVIPDANLNSFQLVQPNLEISCGEALSGLGRAGAELGLPNPSSRYVVVR